MRILRATHLGMCFGVRDAITLANLQARQQPVTVLGQLVHNETVLNSLRVRGLRFADELEQVDTATVIITAHGSSERNIARVRERGFNVIEATCPLVHHAHTTLQTLVRKGFHPIIIGKRDHVEVRGLTGDLDEFDVVLTEEEVAALRERPRFGVVSQTTQPIDRVRALVSSVRKRFPNSEVVFRDTVCQPTKQRQRAAIDLAQESDVVIVIGGAHSNNTRELVETCSQFCHRVHHVQNVNDLCAQWFESASVVGITAGTSTPDDVIDAVEQAIAELAAHKEAA
jgi:4-hydroxy-3-methylbut-2-en-1-yl diphosphate reductase